MVWMSETGCFLGGSATGLFLAMAIVAAVNLGTAPAAPSVAVRQAPLLQADKSGASTGTELSAAGLVQTFPAVAIAFVLGVMVYQLSMRRVESG